MWIHIFGNISQSLIKYKTAAILFYFLFYLIIAEGSIWTPASDEGSHETNVYQAWPIRIIFKTEKNTNKYDNVIVSCCSVIQRYVSVSRKLIIHLIELQSCAVSLGLCSEIMCLGCHTMGAIHWPSKQMKLILCAWNMLVALK